MAGQRLGGLLPNETIIQVRNILSDGCADARQSPDRLA